MRLTFNVNYEWRGISPDCKCPSIRSYIAGNTYAVPDSIAADILAKEGIAYGENESQGQAGNAEEVSEDASESEARDTTRRGKKRKANQGHDGENGTGGFGRLEEVD